MTRHGRRKPKKKRRDDRGRDEKPLSTVELLEDVREVLLAVLLMQACPDCAGTGRTPDGPPNPQTGLPAFVRCSCRNRAVVVLADFGVLDDGRGDPNDDDDDEQEDDGGFEEHRRRS